MLCVDPLHEYDGGTSQSDPHVVPPIIFICAAIPFLVFFGTKKKIGSGLFQGGLV